ncbi:unnamed protein product [Urochloa humidicola]
MADMVASALAQEGVSRASSYISAKLEDTASGAHNLARLEMALSRLEFALERTAKMPITHVSLLRRVKMLKSAHAEGTALLNKHKPPARQSQEARAVCRTFPIRMSHRWTASKNQDTYASRDTRYWRPDPTCCNANGPSTSSNIIVPQASSPNGVPEPVIAIGLSCWISAPEYRLRNAEAPPLYVEAFFHPHLSCSPHPEILLKYGGEEDWKKGSMQEMGEMIRSNALDYLVLEAEPTEYAMFWFSAHGAAFITLRKSINEKAWPKPTADPGRGRGGKRKR